MSRDVERLAAGCLLAAFPGLAPPEWIRRWLEAGLGGVVLFARNVRDPAQVAELTAALRAERPDVIAAIDEEGGDVTRLEAERGSSYPGNLALGVVDDVALTERVGAAMADDLARVGINLNLAPVADVRTNDRNPIVGVRSFGSDPELVSRHVAAFIRGHQRAGVAACAKHFPGHGGTEADSHLELPTLAGDLAPHLAPFRASAARAIMTAHIRVPAFGEAPATLNREILTRVLREELGFDGMVVTDALEMRAISGTVGIEEGAVRALAAGADALCLGHDVDDELIGGVRSAIVDAVRAGRLAEDRLADAAERVSTVWRKTSMAALHDRAIGAEAARRALRVEGNVELTGPALVVELWPDPTIAAGEASRGLGDILRERAPDTEAIRVTEAQVTQCYKALSAGTQLVIVLRDAHRHPWQCAVLEKLLALDARAIVVETGLPAWRPNRVRGYVATQGAGRVNLAAAADRLARR